MAASSELAFLETDLPIAYLADATFAGMIDYYDFYSRLLPRSVREGNEVQERALKKASHLFFPSEWAAKSAMQDYKIATEKIHVLPMGANLEEIPAAISGNLPNEKQVNLLFLGVEWERKGGPLALEVFHLLREKGIDARLTILGCTPAVQHEAITVIPFLNKNEAAQRQKLNAILGSSDFLILPTKAECFGLVFCEASAFGIPSLSFDTGGVNGAVKNGVNGFLFPPEAKAIDFANKIMEIISRPEQLASLKKSSRELFDASLNWDAWGKSVAKIILPGRY